jgi:hypothetical protein
LNFGFYLQLSIAASFLHLDLRFFTVKIFCGKLDEKKFHSLDIRLVEERIISLKKLLTIEELPVNAYSNYHMEQQQNDNRLAYELASALNDKEAMGMYIAFVQKYQEDFLKRILLRVMSIPDNKIKRTRGALFTYLIKEHGSNHFRD